MKKYINILAALFFFLGSVSPAFSEQPKTVFMILWDGCDEACRGFQDYLKSRRFPALIMLKDAGKDTSKIADFVAEAKELRPDLLVTWGSLTSLEVFGPESDRHSSRYIRSIPSLFMVVSHPVESGLVSSMAAQGRNMTGVVHLVPISEQLQSARQFIPFKRLGLIYNPTETNSVVAVEQIKTYASLMNFELIDLKLPILPDGRPDSSAIPEGVAELAEKKAELIYLGTDAFMNAHRDILSDAALEAGIPIFSASEGAVRSGDALFASVHRYYTVGQFAGRKAIKILSDNVQPYDIPIEAPHRSLFVVNVDVAEKLNMFPPLSLISNADMIKTAK